MAFASRLNTLSRAIVVANAETGEKTPVTDGLADAMYPVWDASGKYLWFLASTDFGLGSQWLDMTSYDREETCALYLAVLKKSDPSPLLPESDEDPGTAAAAPEKEGARPVPAVQIDFAGLQQRILPVAGVPSRQYSQLKAGTAGSVFFLEAAQGQGGRSTLHRYRLSDRKADVFQPGIAEYAVSADGKKLVYRTPAPPAAPGAAPAANANQRPSLFLVDATKDAPKAGDGRLDVTLRMHLDPRAEFAQIFNEGWRLQRDDLNYLLDNMGAEIAIGHSYVRGGAMPDVPTSPGGLLGADFVIENGRYKIARIYDGESWNPGLPTRAWVEENRRFVEKRSNGQLAYVYVPNTGQGGYESFNRYYFAQQDKQGAVIDERYNGGGSAADYIIDVLQRDFDGYFNNVAGDRRPFTSPSAGIWGPKVMIVNEMAGSGRTRP